MLLRWRACGQVTGTPHLVGANLAAVKDAAEVIEEGLGAEVGRQLGFSTVHVDLLGAIHQAKPRGGRGGGGRGHLHLGRRGRQAGGGVRRLWGQ